MSYQSTERLKRPAGGAAADIGSDVLRSLYTQMLTARCIDERELELVNAGEAFFHVSGAGHEGSALLNLFLKEDDWLHCHYRDKALMLARGIPPEMLFHSLLCNSASHSAGRQMSAHMSDRKHRILSIVGPMGNQALQAAGIAAAVKNEPACPIVLCSLGDGTVQEGEVLEAMAEAIRRHLPVLFWIEDNHYSISTRTAGKTFYDLPEGPADSYHGIPLERVDGRDVARAIPSVRTVVEGVRQSRGPAIVIVDVDRLSDHTNADDQRVYRDAESIEAAARLGDPIRHLRQHLLEIGCSPESLSKVESSVRQRVQTAVESARAMGDPAPCREPAISLPAHLTAATSESRGQSGGARLTMLEAIREVLRSRMRSDSRVTLYGEDIEDPKGDVFGVTRGLSSGFPERVVNSPLSESTIVGTSIGRALAGERPVAFIHFADFLPLAFNQILSELGSLHWRTNGDWQAPVLIMVACGAYRPGLGPFHAQTLESIFAHVPGIDVLMPSTATDAAGLLNAAFESERPTLYFYPKVCLNDPERTTPADVEQQFVPLGKARRISRGRDLTIVSWGSTVPLCEQADDVLSQAGYGTDLIDLRCISPWDRQTVTESVERTGRLLVVHEDNLTCGFGAEVVAQTVEAIDASVAARRVTRPDTYIPCNFANQLDVLPSQKQILQAAAEMLGASLTWEQVPDDGREDTNSIAVEAPGSSPADQTVTLVEWLVKAGQTVAAGQHLADAEADKSVVEITSPAAGVVERLLVDEGETIRVGTPVVRLRTKSRERTGSPKPGGDPGIPHLEPSSRNASRPVSAREQGTCVALSAPYAVEGSRILSNHELARNFTDQDACGILARTGIETRRYAGDEQTAVSMAVDACQKALQGERVSLDELSCLVCSTTTPEGVTPSTACRILHRLAGDRSPPELPAFDVNAACSGYLYALDNVRNYLRDRPHAIGLVVTTEALSRVVDPTDFDTAVLFGDAATATIVYGPGLTTRGRWLASEPLLSTQAENGTALSVPSVGRGSIQMQGRKVFAMAVRKMGEVLERACREEGLSIDELDLIVPHQANGRILQALEERFGSVPVFHGIRHRGNTSSSSIPLCLGDLNQAQPAAHRIGLCAFGGGFTYGAALLTVPNRTEQP